MTVSYITRLCFSVAIILLICGCENNQKETEKYIIDSESQWAESVATNDTSILQKIMADDCVWILDGKRWNKKMAIADAKNGPGDFVSDHLDNAEVRFFGNNTAAVAGSETWTRKRNDGTTYQGKFVWTDTWIKRNNIWQIVQAEDITVPTSNK